MTTVKVSSKLRSAVLLAAAVGIAGTVVTACGGGGTITIGGAPPYTTPPGGGGGTSAGASPYTLFASNYVTYSGKQPDGAYLHSAQGGDVITGFSDTKNDGSTFNYGCYSFDQPAINSNQFYALQVKANGIYAGANNSCSTPGSGSPPTKVTDYAFIAIQAPGSGGSTPIAPFDISQSTHMLIQMGNTYNPAFVGGAAGGNALVFTVELSDAADGNASNATDGCTYDQRLAGSGAQIVSPLGVLNYAISLSDSNWICGPGSMTALMANGITAVAVKIVGSKQTDSTGAPALKFGELDLIAVGYVGFTKQLGTLPITSP